MVKLPTVTIGIPAYNEEQNIKRLLYAILAQRQDNYILKKIIVISDGSTDQTVHKVCSIRDKCIHLLEFKHQRGLVAVQNEILRHVNEDILIYLNADVLPVNRSLIKNLIEPILRDKHVGLVAADITVACSRTMLEKILVHGFRLKRIIFNQIRCGNNLYMCAGCARAFPKKFYKKIRWPDHYTEDTYSYLYCISQDFKFILNHDAKVKIRLPSTLSDHEKQSLRYHTGKRCMTDLFTPNLLNQEYNIPLGCILRAITKSFFTSPLLTIAYIGLYSYLYLHSINKPLMDNSKFQPSMSSKKI